MIVLELLVKEAVVSMNVRNTPLKESIQEVLYPLHKMCQGLDYFQVYTEDKGGQRQTIFCVQVLLLGQIRVCPRTFLVMWKEKLWLIVC